MAIAVGGISGKDTKLERMQAVITLDRPKNEIERYTIGIGIVQWLSAIRE